MAMALAVGSLFVATLAIAGTAAEAEHPALGTFTVESEIGGAVWTFRDDGVVRLIGPGEMFTMGEWQADDDVPDGFSGAFDVETSLQELAFRGTVSPDGSAIALLVIAGEPGEDAGRFEWPPLSMLVGVRLGMVDVTPDPSAEPSPSVEPDAMPSAEPDVDATAMPGPTATAEPGPTPMPRAANGDCAVFGDVATGWGPCLADASPAPESAG